MTVALDGRRVDGGLLYESARTRVTRVPPSGASPGLIRKRPVGAGAGQRVRHELGILRRLAGIPGVPVLVPGTHRDSVVLEDCGGRPLYEWLAAGPLPVGELVRVAHELAEVLAAVHSRGVAHLDINPSNILVAGDPPHPVLIDFDTASTFAEERPGFTHHSEIVGTLRYMAPEQTGRTGWPVDGRADLYALGATLYEAATGVPPFRETDPLHLIRAHLTQVPAPADVLNPAVPGDLTAIISHLLEKAPNRRYQSAEGLRYDLARIRTGTGAAGTPFRPGERDFPVRLTPPSRLVGREPEIGRLRDALAEAVIGRNRGLLISGAPGVGKSALIDELRPMVTAAGGWYLHGKADQYRRDPGSDVVCQALRGLGRLLLAEPEADLATLRTALLARLGPRAGLIAAVLPEFQALLGVPPDASSTDPQLVEIRLRQGALDLLAAVATPQRPLVVVLDDLQWAGRAQMDFVHALLGDATGAGVLLVGAYRMSDVDSAHPLSALLARWRCIPSPPGELHLANLDGNDLTTLIAEMLRQPPAEAAALATAVGEYTKGNPFDTVELLNALRHEGALRPADDGWLWDAATLHRPGRRSDVLALLSARIGALPAPARDLIEAMACLGVEVELDLLAAAQASRGARLQEALAPALEDGLLVVQRGGVLTVRFGHDRIQQAAYAGLAPKVRAARHLALARRLSRVDRYALVAAEQYVPVVDALNDPAEVRTVVGLLREAARHARLLADHTAAERFLAAAARLLGIGPSDTDGPGWGEDVSRVEVEIEWHAALFALARFDEMDQLYGVLERDCADPVRRAEAACVQIRSLTNRGRAADAVALGLAVLAGLGHLAPDAGDLARVAERGVDALRAWVDSGTDADRGRRVPRTDARLNAAAMVINRTIPPAFFTGAPVMAWLVTEAARVWAVGGLTEALVGPLMRAPFATIAVRADYRTGYLAARRALAAATELGYDTTYDRYLYSLAAGPWFEPVEDNVEQARQAREDLLRAGRVNDASYTFFTSVCYLIDCAPALDDVLEEVRVGLDLTTRAGNGQVATVIEAYRQAALALRGETLALGSFDAEGFDEAAYLDSVSTNLTAAGHFHTVRALVAAVFGDQAALLRHTDAAISRIRAFEPTQVATSAHLLRALALASQRDPSSSVDGRLLAEFDRHHDWMRERAGEAPGSFLHLSRLLEAERAWLVGDFARAAMSFDSAQWEAAARQRPWHHALIAERRARFHLDHGMAHAGRAALREARILYQEWGATGKVRQLDAAYPFLHAAAGPLPSATRAGHPDASTSFSSDMIDMLAVLRASQALSSETNPVRLRQRIVEVVGALTGATDVHLVLWEADAQRWVVPYGDANHADGERPEARMMPVPEAAAAGLLPMSAFQYVQRTQQPLLVEDATRDDRFAHDPYLRGLGECSLLVVPILSRGTPSAMLLLENRHGSGAFGAQRLDTVRLIAGQLSVSVDNVMLYTALERKVNERTEALTAANEQLAQMAVTDPLTGLPNRRRLTETMDLEWRRCARDGGSMAIAMVDIDQFKQYNDHYGHSAGDECLRKVAQTIARSVRDTDLVARFGGEEFVIVLPNTDAAKARALAERIRTAVIGLAEPHEYTTQGTVTVSIGYAVGVPNSMTTPEQVLKLADAELYRAKLAGRNRVRGTGPP